MEKRAMEKQFHSFLMIYAGLLREKNFSRDNVASDEVLLKKEHFQSFFSDVASRLLVYFEPRGKYNKRNSLSLVNINE